MGKPKQYRLFKRYVDFIISYVLKSSFFNIYLSIYLMSAVLYSLTSLSMLMKSVCKHIFTTEAIYDLKYSYDLKFLGYLPLVKKKKFQFS